MMNKIVLVVVFVALVAACQGSPSQGCREYARLIDAVVESAGGISEGQMPFKKGEELVIDVKLTSDTPAEVELRGFGGDVLAGPIAAPATLRYTVPVDDTYIFPIWNRGPGSIAITVTCGS